MDSIQTAVGQNPTIGVEGIFADSGFKDVLSGLSSSRKLVSVAITAADSQDFTITINGTVHTYASDGSATTAEIAVGLAALINAGAQASKVTATGTDTPLLIESDIDGPDGDFTYSDAAGGGGALVETVLVVQGSTLSVGKGVCLDERRPISSTGAQDYPVRLPRVSTDVTAGRFLGVVVEEFAIEQLPVTAGSAYATTLTLAANQCVNVLHKGRALVKVEEAVVRGDQAYCRYAAGGNGIGSFRKSTGTSEAAAVPNAKFLTSAGANALAVIEVA